MWWLAVLALVLITGCGHDVPDHDVSIVSDCNGPIRSALYHFDAGDFETGCSDQSCSDSCMLPNVDGIRRSGDLEVTAFVLTGLEGDGPLRYELWLPPTAFDRANPVDAIWCGWYTNEALTLEQSAHEDCYWATNGCWAEIEVLR